MKRRDANDPLMAATWIATTACCTALHELGFDTEDIAAVMPQTQKELAKQIIGFCYPVYPSTRRMIVAGDAIRFGQNYAERLAASRAGVQS